MWGNFFRKIVQKVSVWTINIDIYFPIPLFTSLTNFLESYFTYFVITMWIWKRLADSYFEDGKQFCIKFKNELEDLVQLFKTKNGYMDYLCDKNLDYLIILGAKNI